MSYTLKESEFQGERVGKKEDFNRRKKKAEAVEWKKDLSRSEMSKSD